MIYGLWSPRIISGTWGLKIFEIYCIELEAL
jgi:hypothetical protein